ncbi:MAG: hypothetical protein WC867_06990 [Candidatus Pacearchaeota archaeon]|jgi:hypothetical protein
MVHLGLGDSYSLFSQAINQTEFYLNDIYDQFGRLMIDSFGINDSSKIDLRLGCFWLDGFYSPNGLGVNMDYLEEKVNCCEDCFNEWLDTRGFVLAHEIAHHYHYLVNPDLFHEDIRDLRDVDFYSDFLAELSAMHFFNKIGKLNSSILTYSQIVDYSYSSFMYFKDNKLDLDKQIFNLSRFNENEAKSFLRDYDLSKKILCYMDRDIFLGMCVHEEI